MNTQIYIHTDTETHYTVRQLQGHHNDYTIGIHNTEREIKSHVIFTNMEGLQKLYNTLQTFLTETKETD